mgnify:CR=1 FL=1
MFRRSGGGGGMSTSVSSLTGMVPMLVPNPSQDRPVRIGDTEADQVPKPGSKVVPGILGL